MRSHVFHGMFVGIFMLRLLAVVSLTFDYSALGSDERVLLVQQGEATATTVTEHDVQEPPTPTATATTTSFGACSVRSAEDKDVTSSLVYLDQNNLWTVNCTKTPGTPSSCQQVVITQCDQVNCQGTEACASALLVDITSSIECHGFHACHKTEMKWGSPAQDDEALLLEQQEEAIGGTLLTIDCVGSGACDVAQIGSADMGISININCQGSKACRKANMHAGVQGTVVCQGTPSNTNTTTKTKASRYEACLSSTAIQSKCLQCVGVSGCYHVEKINQCKWQSSSASFYNGGDREDYVPCQKESTMGDCH
jgi:hypothetical protein